jgi:hypothetical protein
VSKLKKWDTVEILWVDSYRTHGWIALNEANVDEDCSLDHRTIGYFLGETARQISVCQSSKTDALLICEPETQVDSVMSIPKASVVRILPLYRKEEE